MSAKGSGVADNGRGSRPKTAHEFVRTWLRRAIISGEIAGGTHLKQSELAKELEVSVTPVREALRDLATEGLVSVDAFRGAVVRTLTLAEVREIYELRMVLEPLLVRRSVPVVSDEKIDEAAAIQAQLDHETDPLAWVDLNGAFHGALLLTGVSPRLESFLTALKDGGFAYVALSLQAEPYRLDEANCDHHALLDAWRARDVEAAVTHTLAHLEGTMRAIESAGKLIETTPEAAG